MKTDFGTPLTRNEMKNVLGGVAAQCQTSCSCTGSAGAWTYTSHNPIPTSVLVSDIQTYCPTGYGTCSCIPINQA
jgi:hypothetical protein